MIFTVSALSRANLDLARLADSAAVDSNMLPETALPTT
jgi:hypothetical protein